MVAVWWMSEWYYLSATRSSALAAELRLFVSVELGQHA